MCTFSTPTCSYTLSTMALPAFTAAMFALESGNLGKRLGLANRALYSRNTYIVYMDKWAKMYNRYYS